MSKHTPGPLKANACHNGFINIETATGNANGVGNVLGAALKTDRQTKEEVAANAQLWATAPRMLAALRGIRNCHTGAKWQTPEIRRDAFLEVTAAINEAEAATA